MATKNTKQTKKSKKPKNLKKIQKQIKIPFYKNIFFWIMALFLVWIVFGMSEIEDPTVQEVSLNKVVKQIQEEKVQNLTVTGNTIEAQLKDGTKIRTEKETNVSFSEILSNNNVEITKIAGEYTVEHPAQWMEALPTILSVVLPVILIFFFFGRMKQAGGDILSFGKSKAKLFQKGKTQTTFKDVAGNEEAKKEVTEIVDFLKHPEKYQKLGARIPKGILLIGPAGVGKTLMAKAIAGEADVPFYSVAGSEFMEMLVGVGSARVRDLFAMAKATQPSLIFIDEIDAIGRQRGMGIGGGHDEREQTLNQILTEMDGFDPRTNVIVLAATNRPDMLDPALIRAGRFDRRITIPLPDLEDRKKIIEIHMKGKPFAKDVKIDDLAKKTVGFSGADIENMLNEAAILTARRNAAKIHDEDLDEAALKVTLGPERKTLQTEHERKVTAYHEGGHALVAAELPEMDKVQRVSITARGSSLGHTSFPPERDRYKETKTRLESMIAAMLGGRAAEEVFTKEYTSGAAKDIEQSTKLARKMVAEYGMSNLGPIFYNGNDAERNWLAKQMGEYHKNSEEVAAKIDAEVRALIEQNYKRAIKILKANKNKMEKVAEKLLEKETLTGDEFYALLDE